MPLCPLDNEQELGIPDKRNILDWKPLLIHSMLQTVLILVSNPEGTTALNLPRELRKLQEAVQRSQQRQHFKVELRFATTETDLRRHILDVKPRIVHFCGHGTEQGLVLEDDSGKKKLSNQFLTSLLKDFADRIECVVLNACDTAPLTDALAEHINYVIGMNQAVRDDAAIAFAEGFYDALGAGESQTPPAKLVA
ncbi:MAG: CHAT domain-containing protein [Elainella sp.]